MKKIAVILLATLGLSACVAGQSIDFKYAPTGLNPAPRPQSVAVSVDDQRSYVTNGDKTKAYIGHYRAGFGNTWSVTTVNDRPLAEVIQSDLALALKAKGFQTTARQQGIKEIRVAIQDWNFDTYINGRFWYLLNVEIVRADGTRAATKVLRDEVVINGSAWTGARFAFEEEMPKVYARILRQIVNDDAELGAALNQ